MKEQHTKQLAIYTKFSAYGGVSRMMVNLANTAADLGVQVDMLAAAGEDPQGLHASLSIQRVRFRSDHVYGTLPGLTAYLRRKRPHTLLAVKHKPITTAIVAHMLSASKNRVSLAVRLSGNISSSVQSKGSMARFLHYLPIHLLYARADSILAVSQGVADDLLATTNGKLAHSIHVLPNPSIPENIHDLARENPGHHWLQEGSYHVILGIGRLTKRKDFATLIKAFAALQDSHKARLVLLGEGEQRSALLHLASELGVAESVDLPGSTPNPYAYMSRADLLVLSSTGAEGSPNVLKEAMALGLPVVSTDCPSGPREILEHGRLGKLVPVGDHASMAEAIRETLLAPPDPEALQQSVQEYGIVSASRKYLQTLDLL